MNHNFYPTLIEHLSSNTIFNIDTSSVSLYDSFNDYKGHRRGILGQSGTLLLRMYEMHNIKVQPIECIWLAEDDTFEKAVAHKDAMIQKHLSIFMEHTHHYNMNEGDYTYLNFYKSQILNADQITEIKEAGYEELDEEKIKPIIDVTMNKVAYYNSGYSDRTFFFHKLYYNKDTKTILRVTNYRNSNPFDFNRNNLLIDKVELTDPLFVAVLAMMPKLIDGVITQLIPEFIELLKHLTLPLETNSLAFNNSLSRLLDTPFYTMMLKELTIQMKLKKFKENYLTTTKRNVQRIKATVDNYADTLNRELEKLRDAQLKLMALEFKAEDDTMDIMNYVSEHPYIKDIAFEQDKMEVHLKTTISLWEEDAADLVISNMDNVFRESNMSNGNKDRISRLADKIFIEQDASLIVNGHFAINLGTLEYNLRNIRNMSMPSNAHLESYNCLGSHKVNINKAKETGDIIAMIEAILSAYKNLNFTDATVIRTYFGQYLYYYLENDIKCIAKDNKEYTITEYLASFEEETITEGEETNAEDID